MRSVSTLGFAALLLWSATACQGGEGDPWVSCHCSIQVDADVTPPSDAIASEPCNPVAQAGCEAGEKCGQLVESAEPNIFHITCLPEGTVQNGETCSSGPVGAATGFDNCVGGYHCLDGLCTEICDITTSDTCGNTELTCTVIEGVFPDTVGVGVCMPVPVP